MKAEQNTVTSSRWKEIQRKGTERRKPLCEKPIDETRTYDNKEKIQICQPQIFPLRKLYRYKLNRIHPLSKRLTKQDYPLTWLTEKKKKRHF